MKTTVKNLSETKVELTIAIGKEALEAAEQVALTKLGKQVKTPGFRKGKAPLAVVAKHVDPQALAQQTLEDALSKAVAEAFTKEDIKVIDRPAVEIKKYVPGQELEFTAEAEIIPEITLGDYKKLKSKQAEAKVEDKEIEDIVANMQKNFATKNDVERAAKNGDEVVIDFIGKRDGVAFDGGAGTDYTLQLGSGQFIPGFEEGVIGHKAGDEFEIPLTFPKDYHAKDLAGAKVVFEVSLKAVKEVALPELNDEFAAKCGPFSSMDDLRADIRREITSQKEREAVEKLKDELVKELVEKSKVSAPEVLIKDQERSIEQDFMQNLAYQGLTLDSYLEVNKFTSKEEWLDKEVHDAAVARVKAGLVLAELSKELKIEASSDELAEHINRYKQQYANNKEALKQFDQPEVHRDIANRLITEKTVEKLVDINK